MNHWNQRHTAKRLKKLENGKILQRRPRNEETPEGVLQDPEPGDPAEIEGCRKDCRPDNSGKRKSENATENPGILIK